MTQFSSSFGSPVPDAPVSPAVSPTPAVSEDPGHGAARTVSKPLLLGTALFAAVVLGAGAYLTLGAQDEAPPPVVAAVSAVPVAPESDPSADPALAPGDALPAVEVLPDRNPFAALVTAPDSAESVEPESVELEPEPVEVAVPAETPTAPTLPSAPAAPVPAPAATPVVAVPVPVPSPVEPLAAPGPAVPTNLAVTLQGVEGAGDAVTATFTVQRDADEVWVSVHPGETLGEDIPLSWLRFDSVDAEGRAVVWMGDWRHSFGIGTPHQLF